MKFQLKLVTLKLMASAHVTAGVLCKKILWKTCFNAYSIIIWLIFHFSSLVAMVLYLGVSLKSAGSLMLAALTCKCSLTEAPAGYPYKNSNNEL